MMTVPRASAGLLRNHISRPARTCSSPALRNFSVTRRRLDKDDLRGPGGQQPPPPNPGGPEAIQRNWIPILGAALAGLAGYAYITRPSKSIQQQAKEEATDAAQKAAGSMSGRKGDMGSFRSE